MNSNIFLLRRLLLLMCACLLVYLFFWEKVANSSTLSTWKVSRQEHRRELFKYLSTNYKKLHWINSRRPIKGPTLRKEIEIDSQDISQKLRQSIRKFESYPRTNRRILNRTNSHRPTKKTTYSKARNSGGLDSQSIDKKFGRLKKLLSPKEKECQPIENLIFLKTHKTGPSTILNILQRYVINHNKTIALAKYGNHLGWPQSFHEKFILNHSRNKKYNFICNHARLNKERMTKLMSHSNYKVVTILREPLKQFDSTADYYSFDKLFNLPKIGKRTILESFFNLSMKEREMKIFGIRSNVQYLSKNPTAFDMGFDSLNNQIDPKEVLESVKDTFDLVMVSDYMIESIILLKNLLCWDIRDVVHFTLNSRLEKHKRFENISKTRRDVYEWNNIDAKLFKFFNDTLWKNSGEKGFEQDKADLLQANSLLKDICLEKDFKRDSSQPWAKIKALKVKQNIEDKELLPLCTHMVKPELYFDDELKKHFFPNTFVSRPV